MTTRKDIEKALRAEGWKRSRLLSGYWLDPRPFKDAITGIKAARRHSPLETAFSVAMRRKASRERAVLKKAGWEHRVLDDGEGNIYRDWCWSDGKDNGRCKFAYTRSEALQALKGAQA